ncbi:MAG: DUF72 domain-containing protein, partial [Elusimicrobiota bacterium]
CFIKSAPNIFLMSFFNIDIFPLNFYFDKFISVVNLFFSDYIELNNNYEQELGFDAVELNFTYYTMPTAGLMERFCSKTSPDFEFVVKGNKTMTHDSFDYRITEKPDPVKVKELYEYFYDSLQPLRDNNKLGAVLLQFPVFFYPTSRNMDYILAAGEYLKNDALVVEFRNSAWLKEDTFSFLEQNGISYCAVDEPQFPRLMPFENRVTSDTAYIRFHGRNENWFNSSTSVRYDYLYSEKELREFLPEIESMGKKAAKTFLFFNNCHAGSAATNAKMLKEMLGLSSNSGNRELF